MEQQQVATARHHAYLLLSKIYHNGPTVVLEPHINEIPQFAAVFPRPLDVEAAAAEHYHIFSYDILPFEDIFRDPTGLLGGPVSSHLQELYDQSGFTHPGEASHIGTQLAFLAHLCAGEAVHIERNDVTITNHYTKNQMLLLHKHLLNWVPALQTALSLAKRPFYTALGDLTLDLLAEHAASFAPTSIRDEDGLLNFPVPAIWSDSQTNLKSIAQFLATPPYAGFYLGRGAITALARTLQLPRGFGGRAQMLRNLLQTAAQYEKIPALLTALNAHALLWQESYRRHYANYPHLEHWIRPWQEKASETAVALAHMRDEALLVV